MLTNLLFSSYIVYPIIILFLINYLYKKLFALNYWDRAGVPSLKPTLPFLGNFYELFLGKTNIDLINSLHDKVGDRPFAGVYAFTTPLLILKDPDLIKRILVKDFQYFVDRGFNTNPVTDPIARNLIHMTSKDWKAFRPRLASVYTASRVKTTIGSVVNMCEDVMAKIKEEEEVKQNGLCPTTSGGVEMSDLFTRFATDCYTNNSLGFNERAVAYGRKSEFYRYGMMCLGWFLIRHIFIGSFYPRLHRLFKMGVAKKEVTQYFQTLADKCVRSREANANHSIINNDKNNENADLLDTLIALREDSKRSSQNENTAIPGKITEVVGSLNLWHVIESRFNLIALSKILYFIPITILRYC